MVIWLLILGRLLGIYGMAWDETSETPIFLSTLHAIEFPYRDGNLKTTQIRRLIFRRSASHSFAASLIVPIPSGL
jgi:hypothetical protein